MKPIAGGCRRWKTPGTGWTRWTAVKSTRHSPTRPSRWSPSRPSRKPIRRRCKPAVGGRSAGAPPRWCSPLAAAAGYRLVDRAASRRNEQLVRDLPVIENVDVYRHIDSIDFLRRLEEEQIFGEETGDAI